MIRTQEDHEVGRVKKIDSLILLFCSRLPALVREKRDQKKHSSGRSARTVAEEREPGPGKKHQKKGDGQKTSISFFRDKKAAERRTCNVGSWTPTRKMGKPGEQEEKELRKKR